MHHRIFMFEADTAGKTRDTVCGVDLGSVEMLLTWLRYIAVNWTPVVAKEPQGDRGAKRIARMLTRETR